VTLAQVIDDATTSVFHFAAVSERCGEADFDLGMRINRTAPWRCLRRAVSPHPHGWSSPFRRQLWRRYLLWWMRRSRSAQTSYGAQKAIGELLVHDYRVKILSMGGGALTTIVVRLANRTAPPRRFQ